MFQENIEKIIPQLVEARHKSLVSNFVLIGGLAVSAYGVPRATQDIDFAVQVNDSACRALASFLGLRYFPGDSSDPLVGVFRSESEVVQLIRFPAAFERHLFHEAIEVPISTISVPLCRWQGLVLLKLYAGGPIDKADITAILDTIIPDKKQKAKLIADAEELGLDASMILG